jgi:hypothetical protein
LTQQIHRLKSKTLFTVRAWERFQFIIESQHRQVIEAYLMSNANLMKNILFQLKDILQRKLPDALKLSIAKQIENNLFAKVLYAFAISNDELNQLISSRDHCRYHSWWD